MREAIQKVIEAEREAKHLIEAAKAEAARISAQGQRKAEEILSRIEQQTQAEAQTILDDATREANEEKERRLVQAKGEIESQVQLNEKVRREVVATIIRCVCEIP